MPERLNWAVRNKPANPSHGVMTFRLACLTGDPSDTRTLPGSPRDHLDLLWGPQMWWGLPPQPRHPRGQQWLRASQLCPPEQRLVGPTVEKLFEGRLGTEESCRGFFWGIS